jgi:hypothetical protein
MFLLLAPIIQIICGLWGFSVGARKHRPILGAVLGLLFGLLGMLAIYLIPKRRGNFWRRNGF